MDARYCALSRVSFGLDAGGAGTGPGRHPAIALRLTYSPPWLDHRPRGSSIAPVAHLLPLWLNPRPRGSTLLLLAPVAQLSAPAAQLSEALIPGRRRRLASSHGPWAVCLGRSLPCQIKPGPSVAAAVIGVQREAGLGWQGLRLATGAPCSLSHLAGVGG